MLSQEGRQSFSRRKIDTKAQKGVRSFQANVGSALVEVGGIVNSVPTGAKEIWGGKGHLKQAKFYLT